MCGSWLTTNARNSSSRICHLPFGSRAGCWAMRCRVMHAQLHSRAPLGVRCVGYILTHWYKLSTLPHTPQARPGDSTCPRTMGSGWCSIPVAECEIDLQDVNQLFAGKPTQGRRRMLLQDLVDFFANSRWVAL